MSTRIAAIGEHEFEQLRRTGQTAVVTFIATWNRRCQAFERDCLAFATDLGTTCAFLRIDVDESIELTKALDIISVPTTLLLRDGEEVHREVGLDLQRLRELLQLTVR